MPVQATVSTADRAAACRASDVGAPTSDGMPCGEGVSAPRCAHGWPDAPQLQGAESLAQDPASIPAEQAAQAVGSAAQQHQPARLRDLDPAAGAAQLSSPCVSVERGADLACLPHIPPGSPSLQSWGNNATDQCSLASKSVSLDMLFTAAAAAPKRSDTHPAGGPGHLVGAEPEEVGAPQRACKDAMKGDEEAASSQTHAHIDTSSAMHHRDKAPAFWEGRRRSSSSAGHVHGSSAALSALAQAYSRAGQGSPAAALDAQKAQDEQLAASEGSPQEVSELLRVMARKIDSQANRPDKEPPPCPALQAKAGACSSPSHLDSNARAKGATAHNAPQEGLTSQRWVSATQPGPSNPFAAACEPAEMETEAQVELSQAPSSRAGAGSTALPARDGDAEPSQKSVAALSTCCEVGSCIAPPSQCSPFQSAQTVSQGRSNAHSSPDSWNGNTPLSAIVRCACPVLLGCRSQSCLRV